MILSIISDGSSERAEIGFDTIKVNRIKYTSKNWIRTMQSPPLMIKIDFFSQIYIAVKLFLDYISIDGLWVTKFFTHTQSNLK